MKIQDFLEQRVAGMARVAAIEGGLEFCTADISETILGEQEEPDDKEYVREYRKDKKALTQEINDWFAAHTPSKPRVGHGGRKYFTIPWALPKGATDATAATLRLGPDGDYEAELAFPFKISLKARKGQQILGVDKEALQVGKVDAKTDA